MDVFLSALRDFVVALAFSWLGVTLQGTDHRAGVREAARPAQSCPAGASACSDQPPGYRSECAG
jgi:hypothetical protein